MSRWVLEAGVLFRVLDEQRAARELNWVEVGRELGLSPNVFSRMKRGGVPDAHALGSLLIWLGWAPELALLVRESVPAAEAQL